MSQSNIIGKLDKSVKIDGKLIAATSDNGGGDSMDSWGSCSLTTDEIDRMFEVADDNNVVVPSVHIPHKTEQKPTFNMIKSSIASGSGHKDTSTNGSSNMTNPSSNMIKPSSNMIKPSSNLIKPSSNMIKPSSNMINPSPNIIRPSPNIIRPSSNIIRPSSNMIRPSSNIINPSPNINRPSYNLIKPSSNIINPSSNMINPSPNVPNPLPDKLHPSSELIMSLYRVNKRLLDKSKLANMRVISTFNKIDPKTKMMKDLYKIINHPPKMIKPSPNYITSRIASGSSHKGTSTNESKRHRTDPIKSISKESKCNKASTRTNKIISSHRNNSKTRIIHEQRRPHPPIRSTQCPINGDRQILFWNPVAIIRNQFDDDDSYNCRLLVDFHERSVNRNLIYRHDVMRYELCDVNRLALLLVSKQPPPSRVEGERQHQGDSGTIQRQQQSPVTVVHVRPLNAAAKWTEWSIHLLLGNRNDSIRERVTCCCLIGQLYAVVMTERCARYFMVNAGGLAAHMESIQGSPVAIVSSSSAAAPGDAVGREGDFIRVVMVIDNGNQLLWRIDQYNGSTTDQPIKCINRGTLQSIVASTGWQPLPLSAETTLKWIGFSDSGVLFTVDSKQSVRRLHLEYDETCMRLSGPRWTLVLNLRSALPRNCRSLDRYFPIAVTDHAERCCFLAVHCRDSRYPTQTVPWQQLSTIDFRPPLCGYRKSERFQWQKELFLNQMLQNWTNQDNICQLDLTEQQLLLKLFADATIAGEDGRAFGIAKLMPTLQLMELATTYSNRNKKKNLSLKMGHLVVQVHGEAATADWIKQLIKPFDIPRKKKKAEEPPPVVVAVPEKPTDIDVERFLVYHNIIEKPVVKAVPKVAENPLPIYVPPQPKPGLRGLAYIDSLRKPVPIPKKIPIPVNPFAPRVFAVPDKKPKRKRITSCPFEGSPLSKYYKK